MKRFITAGVVALVCAFSAALAQQPAPAPKADYSGVWTLDTAKSDGLPPMLKGQKLTVKQTGDRVEIESKMTLEEGDRNDTDAFTVDGKAADYTPKGPGGMEGKGKRTATWNADGRGIDLDEAATFDTPMGSADVKITRKWSLSADGKTLTIEINAETPMGAQHSKRTFTKS